MQIRSFIAGFFYLASLAYTPASFSETLLEVGIHLGGDELITHNYTNGAKDSLKAGEIFSLSIGGTKSFTPKIEGQLSFGVKSDFVHSTEKEVDWVRYPLNSILFYRADKYRIGLGLTVHFSPKLKGTGVASNISESFKDAIGGIVEVDRRLSKIYLWGLRYTNITYESNQGGRKVSGNSLGILLIAIL